MSDKDETWNKMHCKEGRLISTHLLCITKDYQSFYILIIS